MVSLEVVSWVVVAPMVGSPENVGPLRLSEEGVSGMKRREITRKASQKKRGGIKEIEVSGKGRRKGSGKRWGEKGEGKDLTARQPKFTGLGHKCFVRS